MRAERGATLCATQRFHESSVNIVVVVSVYFARDCNSNFLCLQRTNKIYC